MPSRSLETFVLASILSLGRVSVIPQSYENGKCSRVGCHNYLAHLTTPFHKGKKPYQLGHYFLYNFTLCLLELIKIIDFLTLEMRTKLGF